MKHSLISIGLIIITLTCMPSYGATSTRSEVRTPYPHHASVTNRPTIGSDNTAAQRGVVHLSPAVIHRNISTSIFQITYDKLQNKITKFTKDANTYEFDAKAMLAAGKACLSKSFSAQDQNAAGCTGNETLNQCMEKLYNYCISHYSISFKVPDWMQLNGQSSGSGFNFEASQFQKDALVTVTQARALSQMFSQYADEVEKNAKALAP